MIDSELHLARALLVEDSALLRSVTTSQLREAGVGQVVPCTRLQDARVMLERERYDIVVCNRDFEGEEFSGQDLADELRRERLLPPTTVFIMISTQATYAQVMEAAEAALDGVIVRPFNAATLVDRLVEARQRKRALADILKALEAGEDELAFARALKRFQEGQPYALYCGRLSAELLLSLQRPQDARKLFDRIVQTRGKDWARLGAIRACLATGQREAALEELGALLQASPQYADAHDLHGRVLLEGADWTGAAAAYARAAELTPGCLLRAQHAGSLAFYEADTSRAFEMLRRARHMGMGSRLFDGLSLLLLALIHFDRRESDAVRQRQAEIGALHKRHTDSVRLDLLARAAAVLSASLEGAERASLEDLPALTEPCDGPGMDFEMSLVLMSIWARMPATSHRDARMGQAAEALCLRHAAHPAAGDLMRRATSSHPVIEQVLRNAQARAQAIGEAATKPPGIWHVAGTRRASRTPGSMLLRR